jgi:hypothetical protein
MRFECTYHQLVVQVQALNVIAVTETALQGVQMVRLLLGRNAGAGKSRWHGAAIWL